MLIDIGKIKVNDRIRKDFGNIEELALDIEENGLINPPTVTPEFELIAGERRLRACKHLGYSQIEVRVMTVKDEEHQLKMEISENENRKEFTFSERVDWAKRLERVERIKAKERMSEGAKGVQNFAPPNSLGKTRDIVAEQIGFGTGEQYRKAKFIFENANEELINLLDEKKISIHKAYITIKDQLKEKDNKLKQLENEHNKLKQEKENLNQLLEEEKNKPKKTMTINKEVVPDYLTKEVNEWKEKANQKDKELKRLNKLLEKLNKEKDMLNETNNQLNNKLSSDEQEIKELELKEQRLRHEAHVSMFEAQIVAQEFIQKFTPLMYLQGSMAVADRNVKKELIETAKALEYLINNFIDILDIGNTNVNKVRNEDEVIIEMEEI